MTTAEAHDMLWTRQAGLPNSDVPNDAPVEGAGIASISGMTEGCFEGPNVVLQDGLFAKCCPTGTPLRGTHENTS